MPPRKRKAAPIALVSPAARALPASVKDVVEIPTAIQLSVDRFETLLGGRAVLIETLASAADLHPDVARILGLLGDPAYDGWALTRICRLGNITPGQIFEAFHTAAQARAKILALLAAADEVPKVTKEIARVALPHKEPCITCRGTGQVRPKPTKEIPKPDLEPCDSCNGQGQVPVPADLDRQELLLEMTGLIKKGGGVNVAVQNNLPAAGSSPLQAGFFEQLQQAVSSVLYGAQTPEPPAESPAAPVEAEVIPGSSREA